MANDTDGAPVGRSAAFWGWLNFAAFGTVAVLFMSGVVDAIAGFLLMLAPGALFPPLIRAARIRAATDISEGTAKGEAQLRYAKRVGLFTSLFMIIVATTIIAEKEVQLTETVRVILALMSGLAFVGTFWSIGRLIVEEQDEFIRMLVIRQSLWASGIALSAASVWGTLESADIVIHINAFWWPIIWLFGFGVGAISNRIQYGTWGTL